MLLWFVIVYWVISVGIGLWAATRVHNSKDYTVAGRSLPLVFKRLRTSGPPGSDHAKALRP